MARASGKTFGPRGSSEIWRGRKKQLHGELAQLGARLRRVRYELELTQEEAAEKIGLHPKTLARIELGKANPTIATVCAIAIAYGVPIRDLF